MNLILNREIEVEYHFALDKIRSVTVLFFCIFLSQKFDENWSEIVFLTETPSNFSYRITRIDLWVDDIIESIPV